MSRNCFGSITYNLSSLYICKHIDSKMTKKDDDFLTPSTKKIRFRGDLNSYYFDNHVEDIFDDPERRKLKHFGDQNTDETHKKGKILVFY